MDMETQSYSYRFIKNDMSDFFNELIKDRTFDIIVTLDQL